MLAIMSRPIRNEMPFRTPENCALLRMRCSSSRSVIEDHLPTEFQLPPMPESSLGGNSSEPVGFWIFFSVVFYTALRAVVASRHRTC